jgi:peptidyl-prolyl cis-trans isomerase D
MLDTLRQNSRSALIYVFFGIIILVFVFSFGPGSSGCRSGSLTTGGSTAAKVNGKTIPTSAFEQAYARSYREYSQRAGGAFTEDLARMMKLREKEMDRLVNAELLAQAAEKQGIVISDKELADSLKKVPAFQKDGQFDAEQYQLIIQHQLGTIPAVFEDEMRRNLLAQKLVAALVEDAKVSDDEVKAEFVKEKEKIDLGFVRFSPVSLRAEVAKPTDAQVDAFLKDHGDRVEEYYKQNAARFNKPQRVHARHILVKVDESAPAAEVDAAKKKAEEALAKVKGGADFSAVARQMSEDPGSKDKGGDLGVFGPGTMDPAFQKAAFALKPGEISPLVRSKFGFHVIKVESVIPEEKKSQKDA